MEHLSSYLSSEEESINLSSQTNPFNSYLSPNAPFKTNTQKFTKHTTDKALHFHNHHHLHHNHKKLRPYISLRKRNLSHDYNNNNSSSSDFVPCKRIDIHPYQSPTKNFELSPQTPISIQQSNNHYSLPQKTLYSLKVTKSMVTRVRWIGQLGEAFIYSDTFGKVGVIRTDKGQNLLQLNSPNNSFVSDIQVDTGYDSRVVTSNWNGDLIQWDLTSNTAMNHINVNNQIQCIKPTNPSSSVWLVGLKHGGFEAYDFRASSMGPILKSVNATPGPVSDMLTLQNSQNLVVGYNFVSRGGYNPCLQVFDLRTGINLLNTIYNQPSPPTSFYHHPNLNKWYSKFQNDVINTYKSSQPFQQCKFIKFQSGHSSSVGYQTEISGNLNGTLLASGSNEGKLFIWDINTSKLLKSSQVYKNCLLQAEFHPIRDNLVLTRGDNGWIKLLH